MREAAVPGTGHAGAGVASRRRWRGFAALALSIALALPLVAAPPALADEPAEVVDEHGSDIALIASMASAPRDAEGRVRVIVKLDVDDEVAALHSAPGKVDPTELREAQIHANTRASDQVTAEIETLDLDVEGVRTFRRIPYLAAAVAATDLASLRSLPGVADIAIDQELRPLLDISVPDVGAADPAPHYAGTGLTGSGAAVAVIDTGVQDGHDFIGASRVVAEACYSSAGDCPDGQTSQTGPGAAAPLTHADYGTSHHGTHVAGIAVGATGTAGPDQGVAPGADLIAVQSFSWNAEGDPVSFVSDLTAGLEFVLDQHLSSAGPSVAAVNLSLGGAADKDCTVTSNWGAFVQQVDLLHNAGVLTVAASGNNQARDRMNYPACFPQVFSVGATTGTSTVAWYSNLSDDTDVVAPGTGIISSRADGGFGSSSGTSMAAPHVAGAVALLREAAPDAQVNDLASALRVSEHHVDDTRDGGSVTGLPLLDVPRALTALPGVGGGPGAPTGVQVPSAVDGQAEVTWEPPTNAGDSEITGYHVLSRPGHGTCSTTTATCTVGGLTNGIEYTFTVLAENGEGPGASSDPSAAVVPTGPPGPPRDVEAWPSLGEIEVTWAPPANDGGSDLVAYRVETTGDHNLFPCDAGVDEARSCTFDGLAAVTPYRFIVTAENQGHGWGEPSTPTSEVVADGRPTPPLDLQAEPGDGKVTLTWTEPRWDGGRVIEAYTVTTSSGGQVCEPVDLSVLTCTVEGLTNGAEYIFTAVATNTHGTSDPSSPTPPITPSTVPAAPTGVAAEPSGPGSATVTWSAPSDDGGSPILGYEATASPGGHSCSADEETTTCTVDGMPAGSYTISVVATNIHGSSAASPSASVSVEGSGGDGGSGGSGGGGGGAPPPPPPEDELDEDEGDPGPVTDDSGELPSLSPGTSQLLIGGSSSNVTVTSTSTSLTVSNGTFSATLGASTSSGTSSTLSGTSLQLSSGGTLNLDVQGLEGGSSLHGWLFSDPVSLGSVTASSSGSVSRSLDLPDDLPAGSHTLQLSGVVDDGQVVALNLGVEVVGEVSFPDVDPASTHGAAILRLAELGIVTGFADGTYGPGELVNRGQMAAFLQRALGLNDGPSGSFPDVGGTAHDRAIGAIAEAKIAGGFPDGTYRPGDEVTRGQMATFLANAAGLDERADGPFIDVEGTVHAHRINAVAHAEIAQGYDDGAFRPGDDVTRGQMASFISRMLDHLEAAA